MTAERNDSMDDSSREQPYPGYARDKYAPEGLDGEGATSGKYSRNTLFYRFGNGFFQGKGKGKGTGTGFFSNADITTFAMNAAAIPLLYKPQQKTQWAVDEVADFWLLNSVLHNKIDRFFTEDILTLDVRESMLDPMKRARLSTTFKNDLPERLHDTFDTLFKELSENVDKAKVADKEDEWLDLFEEDIAIEVEGREAAKDGTHVVFKNYTESYKKLTDQVFKDHISTTEFQQKLATQGINGELADMLRQSLPEEMHPEFDYLCQKAIAAERHEKDVVEKENKSSSITKTAMEIVANPEDYGFIPVEQVAENVVAKLHSRRGDLNPEQRLHIRELVEQAIIDSNGIDEDRIRYIHSSVADAYTRRLVLNLSGVVEYQHRILDETQKLTGKAIAEITSLADASIKETIDRLHHMTNQQTSEAYLEGIAAEVMTKYTLQHNATEYETIRQLVENLPEQIGNLATQTGNVVNKTDESQTLDRQQERLQELKDQHKRILDMVDSIGKVLEKDQERYKLETQNNPNHDAWEDSPGVAATQEGVKELRGLVITLQDHIYQGQDKLYERGRDEQGAKDMAEFAAAEKALEESQKQAQEISREKRGIADIFSAENILEKIAVLNDQKMARGVAAYEKEERQQRIKSLDAKIKDLAVQTKGDEQYDMKLSVEDERQVKGYERRIGNLENTKKSEKNTKSINESIKNLEDTIDAKYTDAENAKATAKILKQDDKASKFFGENKEEIIQLSDKARKRFGANKEEIIQLGKSNSGSIKTTLGGLPENPVNVMVEKDLIKATTKPFWLKMQEACKELASSISDKFRSMFKKPSRDFVGVKNPDSEKTFVETEAERGVIQQTPSITSSRGG